MSGKKTSSKWWMWPAIIVAVSTILAIAIVGYSRLHPREALVDNTTCLNTSSTDYQCFQQHYKYLTAKKSPAVAFDDLKQRYSSNAFVRAQCHQITHVIGRTAATAYAADVSEAYTHGDNFCWSGYYHGVMETVIATIGRDKVVPQANNICKTLREKQRYSFYHYNCVHGMGHGFMEVEQDELFKSLIDCDGLADSWERSSCYGGVFMENVMASQTPTKSTQYFRADDPIYPCNAVGTGYQEQCYLMQTSHILQTNNYNFAATFAACDTVAPPFNATCYQSLGRDASGQSVSDGPTTKATCLLGSTTEARSNCVAGAVKDFVSYFHDDTPGKAFCASLPDELRTECYATVTSYYKSF